MSNRDLAKSLIDQIPESRLVYVISYLQGASVPDDAPNADTLAAIAEIDGAIANGAGEHFTGSTADFFTQLQED